MDDPYSFGGAKAFETAAGKKQINVCKEARYVSGAADVKAPVQEIIAERCCRVTIVFGQAQDLAAIFLEAHRQNYEGEWVVSETIVSSLDGIVADLKTHLPEDEVHKLLEGIYIIARCKE